MYHSQIMWKTESAVTKIQLQTIAETTVAFVVVHVFAFVEIFISAYGFRVPSEYCPFTPQDPFEHSCRAGLVVTESQLLFIWECLDFSLTLEGQFCHISNSWLTVFFFEHFVCRLSSGLQIF